MQEETVLITRQVFEHTTKNLYAVGFQVPGTSGCCRIRIGQRIHDSGNTGIQYRLRTRGSAPMVVARLQCHIQGRAFSLISYAVVAVMGAAFDQAGIRQGIDFRVGQPRTLVPTLADYDSLTHHNAADERVGACATRAAIGKLESLLHEVFV